MQQGDLAGARTEFTESLALSRIVGQRVIALEALDHLSELEYSAGNARAAVGYLRAFRVLRTPSSIRTRHCASRRVKPCRNRCRPARQHAVAVPWRGTAGPDLAPAQHRDHGQYHPRPGVGAAAHARVQSAPRTCPRAALAAANAELASLNEELRAALADVRTLSGFIPICANCKKVRDDRGYWEAVETFVAERSNATFSHSICQSCGPKLYGDLWPGPLSG